MFASALLLFLSACLPLHVFAVPVLEDRADDRFTLFDLPTPLVGPCDLENGPDGALWGQVKLQNLLFKGAQSYAFLVGHS